MIVAELLRILRRQERALVVIEPPGQLRGARILEIHDGVFIAVKRSIFERMRRLVGHARVVKIGVGIDAFAIKAGENRGRRSPVKTLVMETNSNVQIAAPVRALRAPGLKWKANKDGRWHRRCQ